MIRLGTAGSFSKSYADSFRLLKDAGLSCLEVEFTYGVRMPDEQAKLVGDSAREHSISLSVHAPYYINLASPEKEKVAASKQRILASCQKASLLGAKKVVFHPGFYMRRDPQAVYGTIRESVRELIDEIEKQGWDVELAPETTGKPTQFGNIQELRQLSKDTGCSICIDFAHIYARDAASMDFPQIVEMVSDIGHFHSHFSGIEFTQKGEKRHVHTEVDYARPLFLALKEAGLDVNMIIESPDPFGDCIKLKGLL